MSTAPAASAGEVAVRLVELVKTTEEAAVAPKETVEVGVKSAPVMVTGWPRSAGPRSGRWR